MSNVNKESINKINSITGMSTKHWGPKLWDSLFTMIAGAYPVQIKLENKEHLKTKKAFITTLSNLKYTLPCSFCRKSFIIFYKELPIEKFSDSRINMLYWLYLVKDKVNKKLICQELDYLTDIHKQFRTKKISSSDYIKKHRNCFKTIPSPPFEEVLKNYENIRAKCSKKFNKCIASKTLN